METLWPKIPIILGLLAIFCALWCLWQQLSLNKLRRIFFAGKNGADLENVLLDLAGQLQNLRQEQVVIERHCQSLQGQVNFAIQKVGMVKFNPFGDAGGNLSFVLALLDAENSGIVITNMHGREHNRIYLKSLKCGQSEIQLTAEEQNAIKMANSKTKDKT